MDINTAELGNDFEEISNAQQQPNPQITEEINDLNRREELLFQENLQQEREKTNAAYDTRQLRKYCALWVGIFVYGYSIFVLIIFSFYTFSIHPEFDKSVLPMVTLLGTTSGSIVGLMTIVTRSLFPNK